MPRKTLKSLQSDIEKLLFRIEEADSLNNDYRRELNTARGQRDSFKYELSESKPDLIKIRKTLFNVQAAVEAIYFSKHSEETGATEIRRVGSVSYEKAARKAKSDDSSRFILWMKEQLQAIR